MKAVIQTRYGNIDALGIAEVAAPTVQDNEVLVRVRATSVHADVWHSVAGLPYVMRLMGSGLRKPQHPIPGSDMAGIVEAVGKSAHRFKPGDAVFGETLPDMQWKNGGTFAELVAVQESLLEIKPARVSFEQAASVPASGLIAWNTLVNEGGLKSGHQVLVNGAGGGVGTIAVQLARGYGAQVTAVDCAKKMDMLKSLGADDVWDYTQKPITETDARFDIILDVASNLRLKDCKQILSPTGVYVMVGHDHYGNRGHRLLGSIPRVLNLTAKSVFDHHLPRTPFKMPSKSEAMSVLKQFLETGKLSPIIDKTFPLEEVHKAMAYLLSEQSQGKIILIP